MASNSNSNNVNSVKQVTPMEILQHRSARKAAGMVGCEPPPPTEFRIVFNGFSDIWTWRPADPMDPHCLCFDCRGIWDRDGTIDAQLVNNGHKYACEVYASLLGTTAGFSNEPTTTTTTTDTTTYLPKRSNGGGIEAN